MAPKIFYNSTFDEWLEESEHGFSLISSGSGGAKARPPKTHSK